MVLSTDIHLKFETLFVDLPLWVGVATVFFNPWGKEPSEKDKLIIWERGIDISYFRALTIFDGMSSWPAALSLRLLIVQLIFSVVVGCNTRGTSQWETCLGAFVHCIPSARLGPTLAEYTLN